MDTQNPATIEVPNFKLAKVGKDREKKRGGAGWLNGGRGAGSGFGGAVGGSGAGGGFSLFGLGATATKALLTILVSAMVSAGAWQYGKMMAAKYDKASQKGAASKLFADKGDGKYADTSDVIKSENSIPNSLGYVSGSTDGMTPEERAKKAAADEAARKAAEDAQKKADADAAAKAAATPTSTPVDPNAIAESAVPKKGLTAGKFGQFGASLGSGGGGLSGGSGLSGGINRNFAGASGLGTKGQGGSIASFHTPTKASSASAPKALVSKSSAKGFAKRQLDNAFAQSRQATAAGKGETAASSAAAPFDNNPGGGNVIAGPGVGNTSGGTSGTAATPNPTNGGGPTGDGGNGAACQSDYAPDINGNCQPIQTTTAKNGAPYQWMIDMAEMLMALVAILALIAMLVGSTGVGQWISKNIENIIRVVGVIIIGLGAAILAQSGDKMIGGIVMAVGGLTVASSFMSQGLISKDIVVNKAAGVLIANAIGALATSAMSKSQLQ
jgi:hypothetical protein